MNIKDVEKLSELARIELSEGEKESMLADMQAILGYVKQIEDLKIEDTKMQYGSYNVWRDDLPRETNSNKSFSPELLVKQFPDSGDGFLKVKKIL